MHLGYQGNKNLKETRIYYQIYLFGFIQFYVHRVKQFYVLKFSHSHDFLPFEYLTPLSHINSPTLGYPTRIFEEKNLETLWTSHIYYICIFKLRWCISIAFQLSQSLNVYKNQC